MIYPDTENEGNSSAGRKDGGKRDSKGNPTKRASAGRASTGGAGGQKAQLPSKEDFSQWYHELLMTGEIIDNRYPVKGMCVWFPFGFAIKKKVYGIIRELLDPDHQETLFPLMIPENEFMKEAQHIKGFEEEVYWVTCGGTTPLDVKLALRPTSETAIYPMFKLWIRSHADMPLRIYQIVNTFRYETKHTRPLIRLREITSFKEAHTVHATWEEAAEQVEEAIKRYSEFYHRLAIPFLVSRRPSWDKFPGADYTTAIDVIMPDGRTLQVGTAHHLGSTFARTYEITYEAEDGEQRLVNQTCYGISERCIAALISVHGDDRGLALPWEVAPVQVVIVPILLGDKERVLEVCRDLKRTLQADCIRVELDTSDERPGAKFYKWEMKGVPLRLEVGPRDIERGVVTVVRRDGEKLALPREGLACALLAEAEKLQVELFRRAEASARARMGEAASIEEARALAGSGVAMVPWCGEEECGHRLEEQVGANMLGQPQYQSFSPAACAVCGKVTEKRTYMARQY
ncbi:MAG: proline--tRNA ligase [Methanothrix sp.]|nr:proline--tRNA ligase [Methanothrix sp.]MBK7386155.1 proline--tRNA ligase [Methanothrix sp.]